jgi:hypothetical protein
MMVESGIAIKKAARVRALVSLKRKPLEKRREGRCITTAQIENGKGPAIDSIALQPFQFAAYLLAKHAIGGDDLLIQRRRHGTPA